MTPLEELMRSKAYQAEISATPRNRLLGGVADVLDPLSQFLDRFKLPESIPLLGGSSASDLTGVKGGQSLLNDMSYGKSPIRGASLQTAKVDPRLLDLAGLGAIGLPLAKNVGKTALKEGARQIETRSGLLGSNVMNPRMNMFAGEGAKTADKEALSLAKKMKELGTPDPEIHKATGWTFGFADGKPRFEIDDSGMSQKIPLTGWVDRKDGSFQAPNLSAAWDTAAADLTPQAPVRVMRLFDHNELSRAYPYGFIKGTEKTSIMDMPVQVLEDSATAGSFGDGSLALNGSLMPKEAKSTTLHELQHAIQEREGFARGGSSKQFSPIRPTVDKIDFSAISPIMEKYRIFDSFDSLNDDAYSALNSIWAQARAKGANDAELEALLKQQDIIMDSIDKSLSPYEQYKRLAGEAEARLTQSRMNMTAPERAASYPPSMFDVPVKDQIVRYDDGQSMSVPTKFPKTDGEIRSEIARRNAALPISEGGLGLPADNMPMDRAGAMGARQANLNDLEKRSGVMWHGSPSGIMPIGGVHVGTKEAARQALEARIGIPTSGKGWIGDTVYGETPLLGKSEIDSIYPGEYRVTGYNSEAPDNTHFATGNATYSGDVPIPLDVMPANRPYMITGDMTNAPRSPLSDMRANAQMKGQLTKGNAKRGYYYKNEGEDEGSISAVVPSQDHLLPLSPELLKLLPNGNLRSRFAAFDPFRRHEADILAGVGAGGLLDPEAVYEEFRKKERK